MTDLEIEQFWRWFQQHASALASDDDAAVADKLHAALIAIDEAIAVEVATVDNQVREVIISGSGEPAAMQKVKAVVNASPVTHASSHLSRREVSISNWTTGAPSWMPLGCISVRWSPRAIPDCWAS
jgi:hypothetical protein